MPRRDVPLSTPRRDLRRDILDAALAVFAEKTFAAASVADVRARADVSNGALFHHFASKEAIAQAIYVEAIASYQSGLKALLAERPTTVRAALGAAIRHQLEWTERNPELARFIYERGRPRWNPAVAKQVEELNRDTAMRIRAWLTPYAIAGKIRAVSDLVLAACVVGPAHFIAKRWLEGLTETRPTAFVEELTEAAWAALAPRDKAGFAADRPKEKREATNTHVVSARLAAGHVRMLYAAPWPAATAILEEASLAAARSITTAGPSGMCSVAQFSLTVRQPIPAAAVLAVAEAQVARTTGLSPVCAFVDAVLQDEDGHVWAKSGATCLVEPRCWEEGPVSRTRRIRGA